MGKNDFTFGPATGFERLDPSYNTCNPDQLYEDFFDGLFTKFKDTFFFSNILQFALVSLMYYNVGNGRYWKILFYSSICGFMGSIIENGTMAYLCSKNRKEIPYTNVFTFFVAEFFWICSEFSIPFLNLTKMRAFSKEKSAKIITYIVLGIFPFFAFCRFWIGYVRSKYGILNGADISNSHGLAFACMAIADLLCTISILHIVKKNNQHGFKTSNINHYIQRSSYMILLCVDVVSILLAVICFLPTYTPLPESIVIPFHSVKCVFVLILAADALLFKYEVNSSSVNKSSSNFRYNNKYNVSDTYNNYSTSNFHSTTNKSRNNYSEINYINKNLSNPITLSNSSQYNVTNVSDINNYKSKGIVKNYSTSQSSPNITSCDFQQTKDSTLPVQNFGFLSQQKEITDLINSNNNIGIPNNSQNDNRNSSKYYNKILENNY